MIVVVLGSADRYADAALLFQHADAHWRWQPAPQPSGPSSWLAGSDQRTGVVTAATPPDLFLPAWQWPLVRVQPMLDPLNTSTPTGVIRWYLGNELLAEAQIKVNW